MGGSSSNSEDTKKQRWGIKQKHIGQLQKMCLHTEMKVVLHGVAGIMVTEGIGGDMGLKVRQLRDEVRRYCKSWLGGFAPDDLPALKKPLQETHGDIDSRATSTNIPLTKLRYSDNLWKPWSICFDVLPLLTMVISEGTRLHTHTHIYISDVGTSWAIYYKRRPFAQGVDTWMLRMAWAWESPLKLGQRSVFLEHAS